MNGTLYLSAFRFSAEGNAATTASRDLYMLHRLVYSAFPDKDAATAARPLFRFDIEGDHGYLYVQTTREPDWTRIQDRIRQRIVGPLPYEPPVTGRLRFRLLAKPSWRIGRKDDPLKGRRRTLTFEADQLAWLRRKGEEHGFNVVRCKVEARVWHDTKKDERPANGDPKPLYGALFDGILVVTDPEKLREAVCNGIGPQKAYGFGLLSLAPCEE